MNHILSYPEIATRTGDGLDAPFWRLSKRSLRARCYAVMMAIDSIAIIVGLAIASLFRFGTLFHEQGMTLAAATLPLFWAFGNSSYAPEVLDDWRRGVGRVLSALAGALCILLLLAFFLKAGTELSRVLIVVGLAGSGALLVVARAVLGQLTRIAFDGDALGTALVLDGIEVDIPSGMTAIDATAIGLKAGTHHPLVLDRLARALNGADSVYVACPPERRLIWSTALQGSNLHVELLIPELKTIGAIGSKHFAGVPTIMISSGKMRVRDEILKRGFDLLLVVPIIVFLAPLMALVALAVKLDSHGPLFFVQDRVGRGNRLFRVFKFRSMRTDLGDHHGTVSASRCDQRITRVGRFIRATSIDELPQLLNILRGEMSFVGPRPHAMGSLAGDMLFWEVDHRYHHRHACKPGLTGLAQVRGFRGATHRREDLINRLRADLEYVHGWGLWRDIAIIFATVKVVVRRDPSLVIPLGDRAVDPVGGVRRIGPVAMQLIDHETAAARIVMAIEQRTNEVFAFCNMHTFNIARRMPELALALDRATVFNDGVGIDIASLALHGDRFPANLNGTDLTPAVLAKLDRSTKVFLIGSAPGIAEKAGFRLAERFAQVEIVGTHHGFLTEDDCGPLSDRVRASCADLLLVGMGNPNQEMWAARHGERTGAVIMCVGAFLDYTAGVVSRAPFWVRRAKAEWLYRLAIEPKRMFHRYVTGGIGFALAIIGERLAPASRMRMSSDPVASQGSTINAELPSRDVVLAA